MYEIMQEITLKHTVTFLDFLVDPYCYNLLGTGHTGVWNLRDPWYLPLTPQEDVVFAAG